MNNPVTYPVGTGNVIGSHSAQDFVWAGRAESMSVNENGTIICNQCNADVESDPVYATLTLSCDCGNVLYEDNSDGPYDMADYFGAETATHTPADTNTPYAGPITEPIGSDVHYGAEKFGIKGFNQYVGVVATAIGIGGVASILIGGQKFVQDIPWYLGGEIIRGVKTSWNAKDAANKTLMLLTFGSLLYLGSNTTLLSWKFLSNKTIVSG